MRLLVIVGIALTASAAVPAHAQQTPTEGGTVHVVGPGDTLWDLARRYLSDPFLWPEIFSVNRGVVSDPDLIFPRERLVIPMTPGGVSQTAGLGGAGAGAAPRTATARTVFFDGADAPATAVGAVLEQARVAEVPVIPTGSFYAAGVLVPDLEVDEVGRLVELVSPTVIPLLAGPQIQPNDRVYMTVTEPVAAGDRLQLLRGDREIPPFGRIHISTGIARVLNVEGTVATVEIEEMFDEVAVGDIAVALPEFDPRTERPLPSSGLEGVLLALENPQPVASREDIAFVNLGAASGVVEGDEFTIYIPRTVADWGVRPEEEVARVQVVRSELLTSAVRVVSMKHPAIEPGLPVRLVAKMP